MCKGRGRQALVLPICVAYLARFSSLSTEHHNGAKGRRRHPGGRCLQETLPKVEAFQTGKFEARGNGSRWRHEGWFTFETAVSRGGAELCGWKRRQMLDPAQPPWWGAWTDTKSARGLESAYGSGNTACFPPEKNSQNGCAQSRKMKRALGVSEQDVLPDCLAAPGRHSRWRARM